MEQPHERILFHVGLILLALSGVLCNTDDALSSSKPNVSATTTAPVVTKQDTITDANKTSNAAGAVTIKQTSNAPASTKQPDAPSNQTDAPPVTAKPADASPATAKSTDALPVTAKSTDTPPVTANLTDAPSVTAKPTDTPTVTAKPTDTPTVTAKPTDTPTVTAKQTDATPVTTKQTDVPPVTTKPTDAPPVTTKPTDATPVTTKPTDTPTVTAKQTDATPVTTKQTDVPPVTTKPTDAPPVTTKPTDATPVTTKPTDVPPVTTKQTDAPSVTAKPTDTPTVTAKPTDTPTVTAKQTDATPVTTKQTDVPPVTTKPTDAPPVTTKPTDATPVTAKPTDTPTVTAKQTDATPVTTKQTDVPPVTTKPTDAPPVTTKPTDATPVTTKPTDVPPVTTKQTDAPSVTTKPTVVPPSTTSASATTLKPSPPSGSQLVYINEIMLDKNGGFQNIELQMSASLDVTHYAMVMVDGGTNKTMSVVYLRDMVMQQEAGLMLVTFNTTDTLPILKSRGIGIAIYNMDNMADMALSKFTDDWTVSSPGLVDALVIGKSYEQISEHLIQTLTPGMNPFVLDPSLYGKERTISRCSSELVCSTDMYALIDPSLGSNNKDNCNERLVYKHTLALKFSADCSLLKYSNQTINHAAMQTLMRFIVKEVNRNCQCGITRMHVLPPTIKCCGGTNLDMKFVAPNQEQANQFLNSYKTFVQQTEEIPMEGQIYKLDRGCYSDCCHATKPQKQNDNAKNVQVTVAVIVSCLIVFLVIVVLVIMYMRRKKSAVYQFRMSRLDEEDDLVMDGADRDEFVGGQEATFDVKR